MTEIAAPSAYSQAALLSRTGAAVRTQNGAAVGGSNSSFSSALKEEEIKTAPQALAAPSEAAKPDEVKIKIARSYRMEGADKTTQVGDGQGYSFEDFIDLINPLQHIAVVGSVYRAMTGDEIRPDIKVAGGALYGTLMGGPVVGALAGMANAVYEEDTGKEPMIALSDSIFGPNEKAGPSNLEDPQTIKLAEVGQQAAPQTSSAGGGEKADEDAAAMPVSSQTQPVQTQPVQSALLDPVKIEDIPVAAPATAPAAVSKTAARAPLPPEVQTMLNAGDGTMRVGDVIHLKQKQKNAAHTSAVTAAASRAARGTEAPTQQQDLVTMAGQEKTKMDNETFGALLQQQAASHGQGNQLPPELVQDMMLMAMDKYKAAQATTQLSGAGGGEIGALR